ncbi:MAG: hypothetical protein IKU40_10395 [Clostridia bacterium]|nr:hypothetical protein [Clostridia bacterium]
MINAKVNRHQNYIGNECIYRYCREDEVIALTDEEFTILQQKLKNCGERACTDELKLHQFEFDEIIAKLPDEDIGLYHRVMASSPVLFNTMYEYSKVFSFCATLGVSNIYDIGCGQGMQGLMLMYAPRMTYIGIDLSIFHDSLTDFDAPVGYVNMRLAQFQDGSDRIFYIEKRYPCELKTEQNNIALILNTDIVIEKNPQVFSRLTQTLSDDFERIFMKLPQTELDIELLQNTSIHDIVNGQVVVKKNIFAEYLVKWKLAMPEFTFFTLGNGCIFGTKNERDKKKLHENYIVDKKNEITAGFMDAPFYRKMMKVPIFMVDRNPKSSNNKSISSYCRQNEVDVLTDKEFIDLQHKLFTSLYLPCTGNMEFRNFYARKSSDKIFDDSRDLGIYKRVIVSGDDYFDSRYRYSKIFSFCATLGISNIYDIGCGQQMQGLMMMSVHNMTYTGIDHQIFHEWATQFDAAPEYINYRIAQLQDGSDRIFYIKQSYPCELMIERNNIAVMLGCFLNIEEDQCRMNQMSKALSRDFERIVKEIPLKKRDVKLIKSTPVRDIANGKVDIMVDIFAERLAMWKRAMPEFTFFTLGNGYIFGTKNEQDIQILQKNYIVSKKNEITTGLMDQSFYVSVMK